MKKCPRHHAAGFTLLELVLVLVIMSIALAVAAPSLRGWSKGARLRDAGDQFLAVARWARGQAVAESHVYRLNVEPSTGRYWVTVQNGMEFGPTGSSFGQMFELPAGLDISMTDGSSQQLSVVDFYPTGRTQAASVRITSDDGFAVDIVCPSPAEGFALASTLEQRS
jgi:general secretion pathway protein H